MSLPEIATREEWLARRKELLAEEKALTRAKDAIAAKRRMLPMVAVDEDYRFTGPDGEATLLDLFDGRLQLIVGHFMFDPSWDDGCSSCSAGADEVAPGMLEHLHARDTTLVYVSRAPIDKIEDFKRRKGWTFPWFSSFGSDFNHDFDVTIDASVRPAAYNFRSAEEHARAGVTMFAEADGPIEMPGTSCFLRDGDRVFHTYSTYGRGAEWTGDSYMLLDLTALGRQEAWEEPKGRAASAHSAVPDFTS